jgi:hypothetical protein
MNAIIVSSRRHLKPICPHKTLPVFLWIRWEEMDLHQPIPKEQESEFSGSAGRKLGSTGRHTIRATNTAP